MRRDPAVDGKTRDEIFKALGKIGSDLREYHGREIERLSKLYQGLSHRVSEMEARAHALDARLLAAGRELFQK